MILSTDFIESSGFIKKSDTETHIHWEKNRVTISSDEGINGGGFNFFGTAIDTENQLKRLYWQMTGEPLIDNDIGGLE